MRAFSPMPGTPRRAPDCALHVPPRRLQRAGRWIFRWRIGTRLVLLMALATLVGLWLAAFGLRGMQSAVGALQRVYEERMTPVRTLSQIAQLMLSNQHQLQLALARTADTPAPALPRPAPLDEDTARAMARTIEANIHAIDTLWRSYASALASDGEEPRLAHRFASYREDYLRRGMAPALEALRTLDHTQIQHRAANAAHLYERAHAHIQELIDWQFERARAIHEEGLHNYQRTRAYALWALPLAVLVLGLLGWWQIRAITQPLQQARRVFARMALRQWDSPIDVPGTDEASALLRGLRDLQARLADNELEIERLIHYDPLTGLPNRRLLRERLDQAIENSRTDGEQRALLLLDLDHFKTINDTQGHEVGDQYLQQITQRLQTLVRPPHLVARIGGDEFVVLTGPLHGTAAQTLAQALALGEHLRAALVAPCRLGSDGPLHHGSASIGLCLFGAGSASAKELLKRADMAMYQAKNAGRNQLAVFDPQMQTELAERAVLTAALRDAIGYQQLALHLQPQVDDQGRPIGAEALLRWQHPLHGSVAPGRFIPLAESSGLILPLGAWVLEQACRQLQRWQAHEHTRHLELSVNVSARQFQHTDFVTQVTRLLDVSGVDATRLVLELTESLVTEDVDDTVSKMEQLHRRGVRFALDDFGTGYSSLSLLRQLPLHLLKIDRSFVRSLDGGDEGGAVIVRTIVALAHSLGLSVIAEGIETPAQLQVLRAQRCRLFQGYLFARPMPQAQFSQWLQQQLVPAVPTEEDHT